MLISHTFIEVIKSEMSVQGTVTIVVVKELNVEE